MNPGILHIIDHLGLGGAQRGVTEMIKMDPYPNLILMALRRAPHTPSFVTTRVMVSDSTSKYSLGPLVSLIRLIRQRKIKVLHCHLIKSQVFGFIVKALFNPELVLIYHEHGSILKTRNHPTSFWLTHFLKASWLKVDYYLATSSLIKERLGKLFQEPDVKIMLLPNFHNLDYFSPANRNPTTGSVANRIPARNSKFMVGFAGRLKKSKGLQMIISLARKLELDNEFHFVIAGDGPMRGRLEGNSKPGNLTYLGYCDQMVEFYSVLDVLVMPSFREAAGRCQFEAMAMGIPIVVSNIKGLNESVQFDLQNCTFDPHDLADLEKKIRVFKDDYTIYKSVSEKGKKAVVGLGAAEYFRKIHELERSLVKSPQSGEL